MSPDDASTHLARLPRPGEIIDERYRLGEAFASGGMAVLMEAEQLRTGRQVAVKLLHPHVAAKENFAARFEREVRVATLFDHPNIVRVYDVGQTTEGALYVVMELLEGGELKELIRREAPLAVGRAVDIALQMLDGLGEAHSQEVVHRDMKPANIHVGTTRRGEDRVKLLDFGIAKLVNSGQSDLTATGMFAGTPPYLAPESVVSEVATDHPRLDVYATGLVLLEMMMGQRVFDGDGITQTLLQHLKKPVQIPALIAETPLDGVLRRATAKHPDERYQHADEMYLALDEIRDELPDDLRLEPHQIPDGYDDTSPSMLKKIALSEGTSGLDVLHDVPQHQTFVPSSQNSTRPLEPHIGDPADEKTQILEEEPPVGRGPRGSQRGQNDGGTEVEDTGSSGSTVDEPEQEMGFEAFEAEPTRVYVPDDTGDESNPQNASETAPDQSGSEPSPQTTQPDQRPQSGELDRRQLEAETGETDRTEAAFNDASLPPKRQEETALVRGDELVDESDAPAAEQRTDQAEIDTSTRPVLTPNPKEASGQDSGSLLGVLDGYRRELFVGAALGGVLLVVGGLSMMLFDQQSDGEDRDDEQAVEATEPKEQSAGDEQTDPEDDPSEVVADDDGSHTEEPGGQDDEVELVVTVASEPTGAEVRAGDEVLGDTELELTLSEDELPGQLVVDKDEYQSHTERISRDDEQFSDDNQLQLEVELEPQPSRVAGTGRPDGEAPEPGSGQAAPEEGGEAEPGQARPEESAGGQPEEPQETQPEDSDEEQPEELDEEQPEEPDEEQPEEPEEDQPEDDDDSVGDVLDELDI